MVADVLPDSRLKLNPSHGCIMGDWQMLGGSTVRIELQPIFCVSCGKLWGYVPKENTVHVTHICNKCFRNDPNVFDGMVASDDQFMNDVQHEMQSRFGHDLTDQEVFDLLQGNNLGNALNSLILDSPYPASDNRPKG